MEIQKANINSSFSRIVGLCSIKTCKLSIFMAILRVDRKKERVEGSYSQACMQGPHTLYDYRF